MLQDNRQGPELSILNRHPSIIKGPALLHDLVRASSDRPAIDFLENGSRRRKFCYRTLHALSATLADKITSILTKLESASPVIPVFLPQCPELYVVILAVLKAGKAFCPLDLDTPAERLEFILQDVSADLLITTSAYGEKIRATTEIQAMLADLELSRRNDQPTPRLPRVNTNDLAYVLYTSGSTGLPKAVSVSHRAVTQSLLAHDRHVPEFTRFLQFAAPTFDVSIFEIFFPWFRGRTLVGCTRAQMLDDLPRTISNLEVDAAELTPTVVSNLVHGRSSVPGLKLLLTIGEMLTQHVIDEFGGDGSKEGILWAMYGPTEAAIHCTMQPNFSTSSSIGMIGSPLDTVSVFIVAPTPEGDGPTDLKVLPVGEVGELVVGGPQVAKEYLNRPQLTAASFIDHLDYGRLYRTGDLAKLYSDGNLELLGRAVAGQVKLRGQRVELGEIEKTVARVDGCRTATVIIIEENLVAFCATGSRRVSRTDVLHTCQLWLPNFMVPSDVLFVSSMPQLPSGKIDKVALESRYLQTLHHNGVPALEPDDHVSDTISRVLKQHMKHDLALELPLASAGLDSLQSIRVASALRQDGYNVGAMDIIRATTLADLIAICRDRKFTNGFQKSTKGPSIIPIETDNPRLKRWRADITHILPCTPLQEAMLAETAARPSAYCNWIEIELFVSRTFDQIRDVLLSLVQANDILRSGFHSASQHTGTFVQLVWKNLAVSQIRQVTSFSRAYLMASNESLLRPLTVQVKIDSRNPRLLFQIHHALYDGWSFDLLLHDLDKLLRGEKATQRPQYGDIVRYYTREQQVSEEKGTKEYWAGLLRDHVPVALPNYNGRIIHSAGIRAVSGRSTVSIVSLFERADELAINPQVFFQAATAYVVSRYMGSTDVVLGNVTSGRTIPVTGVEDILGPCIASLPFRLNFQHFSRVHDILQKTQSLNRNSLQHCTLALREIARAANVRPGTQLFEVLFVWQQSLRSASDPSLIAEIVDSADDLEYKVTLEFEPRNDCVTFRAIFDPSTIPESQIKYLSQQIDEVVLLFLQDTNCKVSEISRCFTDSCRSIANPNPHQRPVRNSPAHAVEKWALKSPDKEAICFGHVVNGTMDVKQIMTYGVLNSRANQLARFLSEHGVGQDQLVGVIMEKSLGLYVSILAILKLGSGYLPLVPDTPLDRMKTIIGDTEVVICISESSVSASIRQELSTELIDFDSVDLLDYSEQNIGTEYNGSHLAYAVFTSGSTGTPKGVLVTQDNLMSNLEYLSTIYPFSTNSRMLQACSQAFDVSVFEIFFSWHVGMCLCTATKDDLFRDLETAINRLYVTHLSLTPTVAALVQPRNLPKVEFLVTAGEALTEHVRRSWAGKGLYQGYGPSETTNICTVKASVTATDMINNIGPPFDNTLALVLDPDSDIILPRGAVGELCFGGAQVFRGYLNKPELTAARIIEHPSYGRIYRSGDLGRLLTDSSILFTGRLDDQLKIRGQRVELGEITSVVLDHERIRDCVTVLVSRTNNAKLLVNFWVPTAHAGELVELLDPDDFRSVTLELFTSLSRRLPSYMVPTHLLPISNIPMTMQAKIDKRLLYNMFESLPNDALISTAEPHDIDDGIDIASRWEEEVARILAQTLDLSWSDIRRTSSFFSLGLDSVSAIRFCNALRMADLGDFAVSMVLRNPSIGHLVSARDISSLHKRKTKAPSVDLTCVFKPDHISQILLHYKRSGLQVAKILPCTPLQEAMLSSGQSPAGLAYYNVMVFDIKGDLSRLQECWALMVRRHEILRTSFIPIEDPAYAFAQVVLEEHDTQWHQQSLQDDVRSHTNVVLSNLLQASKPPVYLAIAKEDASKKLVFCCHHALYDGIAVACLLKEIQDHYVGHELPPPIPYETYLRRMLSQDFAKADQHWAVLFKDFEPTVFPNLTGQAIQAHKSSASVSRCLQTSLSETRQACKGASISLLPVVQAAWAKMLHFYTGESDICFGNVVSGRSLSGGDLERLVAPCFNTLPVRVNFDFRKENFALVDLLHASGIDSLLFQLTPLRRIQALTLKEGGRLFDTLFILQQPSTPLDESIWTLEQDFGETDLPVVCEIFQDQTEDVLKLVLHYHTSLLSDADARVVAESFDNSLSSLIKFPHAAANDTVGFPTHLRAEYNMDFQPYESVPHFLHSGFEQNASLQPERVAVDFLHADGSRTMWSFKILNRTANDIADALIDHGIRPEDIVPIHMPKSPHLYASVLGVLKAGAAFAPIHPDLPEARKRFMLGQLKAKAILCSTDYMLQNDYIEAQSIHVEAIEHRSRGNPIIPDLKDSNLAYCVFTSGSTGTPKGVSMEHRAPVQTIESSRSLVPWQPSSRLLQYAAVTFDMCYYDCFLAWTFGFTLCAAEQSEMLNELPKVINTLGVDLLDLTPSVAMSLKRSAVPGVRWLYCIGEAMSVDIVKEWNGACVNSYGPTEAAFCTTIYPVATKMGPTVIGMPFATTSFTIFPLQGGRSLPPLSIGELYIGGAQLARGYLGRPDLTDERFVSRCGRRFYKTGDIARMLSDGSFEFIGRIDDQVKIRGLRIELGEVNHVLQDSHPDIATVVTQVLERDTTAKKQLVAFLVAHRQIEDECERVELQNKLRKAAGNRLPSYMVPQFFSFINMIPLSTAGKVDRKALMKIFYESVEVKKLPSETAGYAPYHRWTELENQIRDVFARLSKASRDDISPTTSIYQLGLDSISAVQIAAVLRRRGHSVNAADVMKHTTCTDIATYIHSSTTPEPMSTAVIDFNAFEHRHKALVLREHCIKDEDVAAIRPCTPLQKGMVSQFLAKDGSVYMNYLRLQLAFDANLNEMEEAWRMAMESHVMLRTGFTHVEDAQHPFAMIQYTPNTIHLPWSIKKDDGLVKSSEDWLRKVQHKALSKLHVPPWQIRITQDRRHTYLDIAIFHGLFDAQSLQTIFNDVAAAYQGQCLSIPVPLDPVIHGILGSSSQSSKKGEQFWTQLGKKASLCRFPNLAPLRYDPIPPVVCAKQSAKSLGDLEAGCRQTNITIQAAGIASWLSLLSAYTGESLATCGVVLSGRNLEATENAVFPCINTVPFACAVNQDRKEMLDAIMVLIAEVQQHQFAPLKEMQKMMGYPKEPLFDSIFAYQKLSNNENENWKDLWSVVDEKATIEYPVSIEVEPKQGRLEYRLTFLPHVIPKEQAHLILDQLDSLVDCFIFSGIEAATYPVNQLLYSITPAKEPSLPSKVGLLHELVELTATKHPQRVALEFAHAIEDGSYSSKTWTYSELDAEGNKIAQLLVSYGVQPGDLVGVCFDKCPEASFAMLGVLKAGCAFVAIDSGAPVARQTYMVKDSQARAVLSMTTQSAQFKESVEVPTLNLDEIEVDSLPKFKPTLSREIDTQDSSYCLYTSGTTGTPKGCELTHENAVQALLAFQRLFSGCWNRESRWLQFASFHFDVSVLEQYWSWSVGICVVSAPRDLIFEDLAKSISTLGITHIDLTPSLAQILHPRDVPSLCKGIFITGGESLKQEILDVWGPKGVIYNGYGPTEATIGVTMYPRVPAIGKPSNIGRQFDNVGSLVLRPGSDFPVLRGGVGELCVSGKLVGKGYLNRPKLTQERFPHLDRFDQRVYRTGDLVRLLYDGTFDFIGRADDQVKLRGQRLEIGEINSVIKQSWSDISDVATLVLTHPNQQKEQLVAFTVIGRTASGHPEVLLSDASGVTSAKEACHEKLPPYMVPTHFVPLTSMPLNVNNKADVRRLKEIFESLSASELRKLSATSSRQDEAWSKHDRKLRRVLEETLDVSEGSISKDTSCFEVGMDSISVIGVSRALKQAGFANATASVVMRCHTVRRLAEALKSNTSDGNDRKSVLAAQQFIAAIQHRHRRTVAPALSIEPLAIEALAPCTPLQQGMIARSLESHDGLYFNSFQFKLHKKINEEKLRAAWGRVYASTQILRTVFADTEDGYVQAVLRGTVLPWSTQTVAKNEAVANCLDRLRQEWLRLNRAELRQPFKLVSVSTPKQKLLVVHIFHGLYDGNSIGLIFKAVWCIYNERKLSNDAPLFHSALAYGPLRVTEGAKTFWQDHLSHATFTPLPVLTNEPNAKLILVTRNLRALTGFDSTRRKLNVTAQAIAQACWLSVLQEYTKRTVTSGIVISGRSIDLEGADRIVGPMFNTIPYHHWTKSSESWASIIKRVHDFNTAAHPYQHTPLRDIMKWCQRTPSQPLFDTLFIYQIVQDDQEWSKNEAWEILDGEAVADYPLAFEIEQHDNYDFKLTLVTQADMLHANASQELLNHFDEALRQATKDPLAVLDLPVGTNGGMKTGTSEEKRKIESLEGAIDFKWTDIAMEVREEIANLSGTETEEINEMTSIFELGLDSIDAIKLSSRLKKRTINLPVSGIMRGLTIAKMVQHISYNTPRNDQGSSFLDLDIQKQKLRSYVGQRDIDLSAIEEVLPLTPLQEAMIAEMIVSEYTKYYNYDVLKLDPSTDVDKLRDAWALVVEASPILRTYFVEVDDLDLANSFAQIVHQQSHEFWSWTKTETEPRFSQIFETLRSDAVKSTSSQPPFNILHIEAPGQSYLVLSIAHALYDGWSLGLLHADVQDAYCGCFTPRPSYESSLVEILSTSGSDAAAFWQDFLANATTNSFPRRPNISSQHGGKIYRRQRRSQIALNDITSFAKKSNVSLQTLGQTVFALVVASYTQSLDVSFGTVLSGRDDDERSQLLFPTMNTVALRTILHGTGLEMLHYVQDNFTSIKQWQHFPLRKALSLAGVGGRLIESLFIYQKSLNEGQDMKKKMYTSVGGHSDVEYPVCVEMEVVKDVLVYRCAVKEEVFSAAGAKELLERLDDVLRHIMERPEASVIEDTWQGTSICGLPPFEEKADSAPVTNDEPLEKEKDHQRQPQSKTVRKIREVLAAVSKVPEGEITSDMTIFHIGLDSISAIKVSSLLHKQNILLGVGDMLRAGTVEKMAKIVLARAASAIDDQIDYKSTIAEALQDLNQAEILRVAGIQVANVKEVLPVTAGQLYMLSMWIRSKGSSFYPEFTYEVHGSVTFEVLQRSWQALVNANAILRTVLIPTGNDHLPYLQTVLREVENPVMDITECTEHQAHARLERIAPRQPWAHLFVSRHSTCWDLILHIHHVLYDGVSLPLLMQQFQDLCNGVAVSPADNVFATFVASNHTVSGQTDRKSFWKHYLQDTKQQHSPQPMLPSGSRVEVFRPALLESFSLEKAARKHGVSTQSLVLATYAKLYATMTQTPQDQDVVIGVYLANRSLSIDGLDTAAGPTVNLLPLRVSTTAEQHILKVAARIQHDLRNISSPPNASASLFEISQWAGIKVDTFVNFLTLPDTGDVENLNEAKRDVSIRPTKQWQHVVSRVSPVDDRSSEVSQELVNERVSGAYLHAINIEATIRNAALDIGVFAPAEMLSLEQGEEIVENIRMELESL